MVKERVEKTLRIVRRVSLTDEDIEHILFKAFNFDPKTSSATWHACAGGDFIILTLKEVVEVV